MERKGAASGVTTPFRASDYRRSSLTRIESSMPKTFVLTWTNVSMSLPPPTLRASSVVRGVNSSLSSFSILWRFMGPSFPVGFEGRGCDSHVLHPHGARCVIELKRLRLPKHQHCDDFWLRQKLRRPEQIADKLPKSPIGIGRSFAACLEFFAILPVGRNIMKLPIRVFIVEDQPLVRRGVLAILEEAEGIEAVGAADDGAEVLAATGRLRPDIVFLDLQRADAFEMIRTLLTHYPEVRIVALSDGDGDARALAAVRAGVYGYVSRSEPASEL